MTRSCCMCKGDITNLDYTWDLKCPLCGFQFWRIGDINEEALEDILA